MERENELRTEPRTVEVERKRNAALARYDAHPGIAIMVLAVMALLFIVIAYQFMSGHVEDTRLSYRADLSTRAPTMRR
jgi:hypothetical protein